MTVSKRLPSLIILISLLLSTAGSAVWARPVRAASLLVTNTSDYDPTAPGSEIPGSLRAAIAAAGSGDTIYFDYSLAGETITLVGPALTINKELTINGATLPGPITISGNDAVQVFRVDAGAKVTMFSLVITGGKDPSHSSEGKGGGIYNKGDLTIFDSIISDNSAESGFYMGSGGGIYNEGTLVIQNCMITGNVAPNGAGGGIYNLGTLTITETLISHNSAGDGGGILLAYPAGPFNMSESTVSNNDADSGGGGLENASQSVSITNSTFSGNLSGNSGGGIRHIDGVMNLVNVTISGNTSQYSHGGGIDNQSEMMILNSTISGNSLQGTPGADNGVGIYNQGDLTLINSIVANSLVGNTDCYSVGGTIIASMNIIERNGSGVRACGAPFSTDDPKLGPLADNGGKTMTHALLASSPAIDTASMSACPFNDQRGLHRDYAGNCDIGAFEYGYPAAAGTVEVSAGSPADGAKVFPGPSSITVAFNKGMLADGSQGAANWAENYMLFEDGANGAFETSHCALGMMGDDAIIHIDSAVYNAATNQTVLGVNGGVPISAGRYRVLICGTTSIHDLLDDEINGGLSDSQVGFIVGPSPAAGTSGNFVPATGFAIGQVTSLPGQPFEKKYALPELTLEIPSLKVKTAIVGVPQTDSGWDVTWLCRKVGYLYGSAFPTWEGNSVITGHVWDADNQPGVFAELKKLKVDDTLTITAYGQVSTYRVTESFTVKPDAVNSVMKTVKGKSMVTLVTCEDYDEKAGVYPLRRLVRAELVK